MNTATNATAYFQPAATAKCNIFVTSTVIETIKILSSLRIGLVRRDPTFPQNNPDQNSNPVLLTVKLSQYRLTNQESKSNCTIIVNLITSIIIIIVVVVVIFIFIIIILITLTAIMIIVTTTTTTTTISISISISIIISSTAS